MNWNKILDTYLLTRTISLKNYENLSFEHKYIIQELKKAFKRIAYPNREMETKYNLDKS